MEAVIFWLTPLSATLPGSNATLLFLDQDQSSNQCHLLHADQPHAVAYLFFFSVFSSFLFLQIHLMCCGLPCFLFSFLSFLLFFFADQPHVWWLTWCSSLTGGRWERSIISGRSGRYRWWSSSLWWSCVWYWSSTTSVKYWLLSVQLTILSSLCETKNRFCILYYKLIFTVFNVTKKTLFY